MAERVRVVPVSTSVVMTGITPVVLAFWSSMTSCVWPPPLTVNGAAMVSRLSAVGLTVTCWLPAPALTVVAVDVPSTVMTLGVAPALRVRPANPP